MRISAKADYAVRAAIELASAEPGAATSADALARAQEIPRKFLETILGDLRRAGLVRSVRGLNGGYHLAHDAARVSVADVVRAVDGPLMSVRGARPPELAYTGSAEPLLPLWVAVRANVRAVLETVTLADLASGRLPEDVLRLSQDAAAWDNP
ncbi:RrF2 family transcriptional regulator [Thalassiella azotivora]